MNDIRSLIEKLEQINESEEVNKLIKNTIDKDGVPKSIEEVENDVKRITKRIRDELQSRDSDSSLTSFERGFKRFAISPEYIQRQYLGTVAEKLGLPGLYALDGKSYVYTDKDQSGNYKSARFASIEDAVKLYKAGYVTRDKAVELQKDNEKVAFKDPKHPSGALFGKPGTAAGWHKTNPIPSSLDKVASQDANPLGTVDGGQGALGPKPGSSTATAFPVAAPGASNSTSTTASTSVNKLIQDLNKELTTLKQGFPEFFESIKHAGMYLKEDAYPNAKKISQIIQQLNDLRDQADDESKTKIDQALNSIPQKFTKDWIAKKVAQDGYPALYGLKPKTAAADANANADTSVAAPAASNTATSKGQSANKKITWQDLVKLNPEIKDPNKIYPGQEIKLPNGSSAVVDQGDTLSGIAQRWNQGGYNDEPGAVDNAPQSSGTSAAPSTAPSATPAPVPSSSTGATVPITPEITSRAKKLNSAIGMLGIDAGAVDNVFKSIPNKETFLAVSQEYKRISGKDLIRELNGSWTHKAELVVNPLLKKWGIPPLAEQNEVLNLFSRMENYK